MAQKQSLVRNTLTTGILRSDFLINIPTIVMRSFTCEQKNRKRPTKDEHAALVDDSAVMIPRGRGGASCECPTCTNTLLKCLI